MATLAGIAKYLVDMGLLQEDAALSVTEQANSKKLSFVRMAVFMKLLPPGVIAQSASIAFGIPYYDISTFDQDQIPIMRVKAEMVENGMALPLFQRGSKLFVA